MMTDRVRKILSAAFGKNYITAAQTYKFIKKNDNSAGELIGIIDRLVNEGKMSGEEAFEVLEYISSPETVTPIVYTDGNTWLNRLVINPWDGDRSIGTSPYTYDTHNETTICAANTIGSYKTVNGGSNVGVELPKEG